MESLLPPKAMDPFLEGSVCLRGFLISEVKSMVLLLSRRENCYSLRGEDSISGHATIDALERFCSYRLKCKVKWLCKERLVYGVGNEEGFHKEGHGMKCKCKFCKSLNVYLT